MKKLAREGIKAVGALAVVEANDVVQHPLEAFDFNGGDILAALVVYGVLSLAEMFAYNRGWTDQATRFDK